MKSVIPSPRPVLSIKISLTEMFWKTEGFFYELFWHSETKNYDEPSYAKKLSEPEFFWNTRVLPTKNFGTVRQKTFDGKSWNSRLIFKKKRNVIFFETQKGPSTNSFGNVRQKEIGGNLYFTSLSLLSIKISMTEFFWNTQEFF